MKNLDFCGDYHLLRLDGASCPINATLLLVAKNDVEVVVRVANTLRGTLKLEDNKLTGLIEGTKMIGSDEEMILEDVLKKGFETGFTLNWTKDRLSFVGNEHEVCFERDASAERLIGGYSLTEFNKEPIFSDDAKMVIRSGGEGRLSVFAQFSGSLRGEVTLKDNIIQGKLASTVDEVDDLLGEMEGRFHAGMESGFRVSIDSKQLVLEHDGNIFAYIKKLLPEDIVGEYILESLNDIPVQSDDQITLVFTKGTSENDVDVLAKVCNVLNGNLELQNDTLCGAITSTMMIGSEEQMLLEDKLTNGFEVGFSCVVVPHGLMLLYNNEKCAYTKAAILPYENGKPTYLAREVTPCFKNRGNGLLFRINNETERKWAFYNDTTKYHMHVTATFGSRSRIKPLGNTQLTVNADGQHLVEVTVAPCTTEMFIMGHVNGYKISYDALLL